MKDTKNLGWRDLEWIDQVIQFLKKRPPPKKVERVHCACGHEKDPETAGFSILKTRAGFVVDNVCPGCKVDVKGLCPLVCTHCKSVVGRLKPHKDPSGFVYTPDTVYHLETCGYCNPDVRGKETPIIEANLKKTGLTYQKGDLSL